MAYTKTTWLDRAVQFASRYTKSGETSTEVTLTASPGTVTQAGTPANAANLNKLEQGVADAHVTADAAVPKTLGVMRRTPPTTNLNDAIAPGIYLLGTDATYTNGVGMDYCTLTVHSSADTGYIIQEAVQVLAPYQRKYRMRTESTSGWGAWQYVWDSAKMRINSGGSYLEWNNGGTWRPVGGVTSSRKLSGTLANYGVTYNIINVTGAGSLKTFRVNNINGTDLIVTVTIDGVLYSTFSNGLVSSGSIDNYGNILSAYSNYADITFKQSLLVTMYGSNVSYTSGWSYNAQYDLS
ncbi:hypothetical protein PAECIP111891_06713 [Paenibacillus allorhizoplanae]|uniref:Tail fiber protein n=1 Tax=Paenibacillus allorhizoplanae TaxID=2905648 RepID=A0ABM9CYK8_9BACL|nr:pyocin knob domain-containing protein [Paenibacillus allorhizoplanae]CAH1230659.1 hypothetical protein PAECIP111891_06713 [Paenibacillus allorhizoplanae]